MNHTEEPVVVEQTFPKPMADVWDAITNIKRMTQWYFNNIPDFKPEVGFHTEFLIENEGRRFPHIWDVTEVIPGTKITYEWQFGGYPGKGATTWELSEQEGGTLLRLTFQGLEPFPDDVPEFKRESCQGGWQYFIQGMLKDYLAKDA